MSCQADPAPGRRRRREVVRWSALRALRPKSRIRFETCVFPLLALLLQCACAAKIRVPTYRVEAVPAGGRFLAGAGKQDITPPPGLPMGGYSIAGKISRGHWTRLYCRAFYFQEASGESLALVSCDLFAVPRGLHARVAHALAAEGVTPDGLILAATHTHQGPGNYMSSRFYNGFASPLPGFSKDLFEFLAQRITAAVRQAISNARQSADPAFLVLKTGRIEGLVRNRAFEAFEKNPDGTDVIGEGPTAPSDCSAQCDRYRAVDPTVTVLEVRHGIGAASRRTAALVFFAVHPTSMSNHFGLYNPDLAGRAMRRLERVLPDTGFVAGFFNGAEGDVSPNWKARDVVEVRALGDVLAEGVQRVLDETDGVREPNPRIRARLKAVPRSDFCHGVEPLFGVASVGGAADGYTALHGLGWRRGPNAIREKDLIPGQGRKQPALDAKWLPQLEITRAVGPPKHLPREVPVSVARLGPLFLAAVPVEMTTMTGRRLQRKLRAIGEAESVALIGLANEYLSYVATAEEYEIQDYEGASTIFGPAEAECFSELLRAAAGELERPSEREVAASVFPSGPKGRFGPEFWIDQPLWWPAGLEKLVARSSPIRPEHWPRFEWNSTHAGGPNEVAEQQVLVHQKQGAGWRVLETEDDANLLILLLDGRRPRRWNATWMPPEGLDPDLAHAFQVRTDGVVQCSIPFSTRRIREGQVSLPLQRADCSFLREP